MPNEATQASILIADDDPELRELMAMKLSKLGHRIHEVSNGAELLEELQNTTHDLIISDLQMPLLSGIEALVRLRREDWSVPFILMTGFPGPTTHDRANRLGAAYILHKPLDLDYLCKIVQQVVAG
jgi:CheY-like chemotaxis protein